MRHLIIYFTFIISIQGMAQKTDLKEVFLQHDYFQLNRYYDPEFINKDTFMIYATQGFGNGKYHDIQITFNQGLEFIGYQGPLGMRGNWLNSKLYINYTSTAFKSFNLSDNTTIEYLNPYSGVIRGLFTHQNTVFAHIDKTLFISLDTCKTWQKTNVTDQIYSYPIAYSKDSVIIINYGSGKTGPYYRFITKDGGFTWKHNQLGLSNEYLDGSKIGTLDSNIMYVFSNTDKTLSWSKDGGRTFDPPVLIGFNNFDGFYFGGFANKRIGYTMPNKYEIYKTYDGGKNWELKHTFDEPFYITEIKVLDSNHVFFLNYGNTNPNVIYVTNNGLETIVNVNEPETLNFHLYPNPANQSINLQTPNGANAALSIYNLMGQIQYQNPAQAPGAIDISHLATGLYIFELRQGAVLYRQRIEVVK